MAWAIVTIPGFQEIARIVRILPPPLAWIGVRLAHSKPQCFSDSRDANNDSIWAARREIQRRRRHAPSCMGATDGQRNWPEMRTTLGKPWFLSGEDRNRTFECFPSVFEDFERWHDGPMRRRVAVFCLTAVDPLPVGTSPRILQPISQVHFILTTGKESHNNNQFLINPEIHYRSESL